MKTNNYIDELSYLMGFHNLKRIPLYEGETYTGSIILNGDVLSYDKRRSLRYYVSEDIAIRKAREQFDKVLSFCQKIRENKECELTAFYTDSNPAYNRVEKWSGKPTELFEKLYAKNHSLQYCGGCYWKFNREIQHEYLMWLNLMDDGESLSLYMRNGGDMW